MFKKNRNNIVIKSKVEEVKSKLFKMLENMSYEELIEIEKMLDEEGSI